MFAQDTYEIRCQFASLMAHVESMWTWVKSRAEERQARNESRNINYQASAITALIESYRDMARAYFTAALEAVERPYSAINAEIELYRNHERRLELLRNYQKNYVNNSLHQIIAKLSDEWMRITPVIQFADPSISVHTDLLTFVARDALRTLNYESKEQIDDPIIVPNFGRRFEYVSFHYAPHVALVGIPLSNLRTPWHWSVIWHEISSQIIAQPRIQQLIRSKLKLYDFGQSPTIWEIFQEQYGGRGLAIAIDKQGWLEELMEDACSVLTLGPVTIDILADLFNQFYPSLDKYTDARHPAPALRLEVARQLLKLMELEEPTADSIEAQLATWIWLNRNELVRDGFFYDPSDEAGSNLTQAAQLVIKARLALGRLTGRDKPAINPAGVSFSQSSEPGQADQNEAQTQFSESIETMLNELLGNYTVESKSPHVVAPTQSFTEKPTSELDECLSQWSQLEEAVLSSDYLPTANRGRSQALKFIEKICSFRDNWDELLRLDLSRIDNFSAFAINCQDPKYGGLDNCCLRYPNGIGCS